jgi:glycerol uptake facilitator-like aquaporin
LLCAIILTFGAISAHFNPVVTITAAIRGEFPWGKVLPYLAIQVAGAIFGVIIANLMFGLPAVTISDTARTGGGQWLAEVVATFGLLGVIFGCGKSKPDAIPFAVAAYVAAAIYFTSSTCFANPAVTIARIFTNTLTGILPAHVPAYIAAQLIGAVLACGVFGWLFADAKNAGKAALSPGEDFAVGYDDVMASPGLSSQPSSLDREPAASGYASSRR